MTSCIPLPPKDHGDGRGWKCPWCGIANGTCSCYLRHQVGEATADQQEAPTSEERNETTPESLQTEPDVTPTSEEPKPNCCRKILEELIVKHDQTCGAIFPKNERDNCNFRELAIEALSNKQGSGKPKDPLPTSPKGVFTTELVKILDRYENYVDCEEYHIHTSPPGEKWENTDNSDDHRNFDKDKAVVAIQDLMLGLIGEDHPILALSDIPEQPGDANEGRAAFARIAQEQPVKEIRNKLKAELRQKVRGE